jgi:hypothetical protein
MNLLNASVDRMPERGSRLREVENQGKEMMIGRYLKFSFNELGNSTSHSKGGIK